MKSIIRQILIVLTLIAIIRESQCERNTKSRLSQTYRKINKMKKEEKDETVKGIDMDCVRDFFKLPQSDKMIINDIEEMVFIFAAFHKCADDDKVFKSFLKDSVRKNMNKSLNCFRWHLQQHEPESKLIENVQFLADEKKCIDIFQTTRLKEHQAEFEKVIGPLNVFSCGAVTGVDDFTGFIAKGTLIKYGDYSEEQKASETDKLKEYFKNITFTTTNCITKRYEEDPTALVNDSLNYYLRKYMQPTKEEDTEDKDVKEYYKILAKVEDSIDRECVKVKLDLPKNGHKALLEIEATLLIASAKSKCIKTSFLDFGEAFLNYIIEDSETIQDDIPCVKYYLQKIESSNASFVEEDENHCGDTYIGVDTYGTPEFKYESSIGLLNETTCGAFTHDTVQIITYKTLLLAFEEDKYLKENNMKELFAYATDKLHKLSDCILERI